MSLAYATMFKWVLLKWELIIGEWQRYMKLVKREVRLIVCAVFLLFLLRILYGIALDSSQPLSLSTVNGLMFAENFGPRFGLGGNQNLGRVGGNEPLPVPVPVVKGTSIVGRDAVERFRAHLDCFSEAGKWVYDPIPRHIPWNYVGDEYADVCETRHKGSGIYGVSAEDVAMKGDGESWAVREELKWVWQTNSSCPWRSINRDHFCRKIGAKRHVMMVGDSINHEIQWSLMNALIANGSGYARLSGSSTFNLGPYEMCNDLFGDGQGFTVSFICNVHLTTVSSVDDTSSIQQPWIHLLDQYDVKILLLNTGAHYIDDESYSRTLQEAFTILSRRYPHIHVIYRNTQPGHLNCMTYKEPLSAPQEQSSYGQVNSHHWFDFKRQNLLAKKIVEEFGYTYMDVYTMLSSRPEAHISDWDCLHYCLPGPLEIAVEYLYNILALV